MPSINPTTGKPLEAFPQDSPDALEQKVARSHEAFARWRTTSLDERADLVRAVAGLLRDDVERLARRMTDEMGKPIGQARGEVEKCAWACEYFADNAARILAPRTIETDASRSYVTFDPLGPVLAIMPWNFPFWQLFRFAAPALLVGNVVLLKHAANVPGCAHDIEELFTRAGFPDGVFLNVFAGHDEIETILHDRRVAAVTLTGSVGAGRAIAATAGSALKKCVLELGGSDPFIVLADCDLEQTLEHAVFARMQNNGQSCIAAKRFIVERSIYDTFVTRFAERIAGLVVGDPHDEATQVGPMARGDLRDELHEQVERTVAAGARLVVGGKPVDRPGFFYEPTLLADVTPEMSAFAEETFGPVAAVTPADDADHAVRLANDSDFALGASIWTAAERGEALARDLVAGHVAINGIVKSDPRLPFGGLKDSGYGRELSEFGMLEFTNIKTIWIR